MAVVSAFHRYELGVDKPIHILPEHLTFDEFFIGNPGWQGSNTFIEAEAFWQAGGYDESMPSTQDRDFAIRVLEVSKLRGKKILVNEWPLLRHHAHTGERVTLCQVGKRKGLDLFYEKYAPRMDAETREASFERAERLFGYRRQCSPNAIPQADSYKTYEDEPPVKLVIGVTSSCARNVRSQITSIERQIQQEQKFDGQVQYLLLTNGGCDDEIKAALQEVYPKNFSVRLVDLAEQEKRYACFPHSSVFDFSAIGRKSIAFSRSLLHFFSWEEAKKQGSDCKVLILDDDLQFESLSIEDGTLGSRRLNFLGKISSLIRNSDADIIVSPYSDAPALPFYSSLRTQLVDVYYTLLNFSSVAPGQDFDADIRQLQEVINGDDYYYDFSSARFDHLECPVIWQPDSGAEGSKVAEVFSVFLRDIQYLNEQANISRPLLASSKAWNETAGSISYRRGGIALYRKLSLLVDVPNLSVSIEVGDLSTQARRSDFISAIHMVKNMGVKIEEVSLPLRHHRRIQEAPCEISATKLADDIVGLCFYRVFSEFYDGKFPSEPRIQSRFLGIVDDYLELIAVNHLRADQLVLQIRALLSENHWWMNQSRSVHGAEIEAVNMALDLFRINHLNGNVVEQIGKVREITKGFDVVSQIQQLVRVFAREGLGGATAESKCEGAWPAINGTRFEDFATEETRVAAAT